MTCLAPQQVGRRCADVALSHPRLRFPALVELGLTLLSEVERGRQPREGDERRKGRTELNEDDRVDGKFKQCLQYKGFDPLYACCWLIELL